MAGLLYLIRLFVYHVAETEEIVKTRFRVMEKRLYRYITVPGMLIAVVSGVLLILTNPAYYMSQGWFYGKLLAALFMIGITHHAGATVKRLAIGDVKQSERYFRILNEIPTILLILIIILVVFKPSFL